MAKYKRIKVISGILIIVLAVSGIAGIYLYSKLGGYDYLNKDRGYYKSRAIETPVKLWLNGYLGLFFRTKMFGFLSWLMIPILIYFLFTMKNKKQWQRALFLVYFLSVILVAIKGYRNYRYALTLYPFTIGVVVWFSWDYLKSKPKRIRLLGIGFFSFLLICNAVFYSRHYRYQLWYAMHFQNSTSKSRLINYVQTLPIDDENNILVCNIIEFFYFTDFKATMFRDLRANTGHHEEYYQQLLDNDIKYILASDYIHERYQYRTLSEVVNSKTITLNRAGDLAIYELIIDR
jgi:hypothetical protein